MCKCKHKLTKPYTIEDLEVVIATMNRITLDFLLLMFPDGFSDRISILIINQTNPNEVLTSNFANVRVINSFEKGLSKSRNLGIKNAKGKLLIIADDDEVFQPNFEEIIIAAHQEFPNSVVIGFQIENEKGKLNKKYPKTSQSYFTRLQLFSVLSIEISFKASILNESTIKFDEQFGLGAQFEMGEEAILLVDLQQQHRQISYVPKVIASHEDKTSTDKMIFSKRYFIQGAFLSRIKASSFGLYLFQKLFFDVKQGKLQLTEVPKAINYALIGRQAYLQNIL